MTTELFQTTRNRVLEQFREAGQPFEMASLPYHSTRQLIGTVEGATAEVAFVNFAAGQTMRFFSYGLGERVTLGPDQLEAGEAETNLSKGSSTNGASDFVIEGLGFSQRGKRISYTTIGAPFSGVAAGNVLAACQGGLPIYDPGSVIAPPQLDSPYNLENGIFQALLPFLSLECEWDRKSHRKLGIMDLLPCAGGASMLRANGLPTSENRYRVPEGMLWRRDGQPAGEFAAVVTLERSLEVAINRIALPGNTAVDTPAYLYIECVMRVFGFSVDLPVNP